MECKTLLALKRHDQVDEIISYLGFVAGAMSSDRPYEWEDGSSSNEKRRLRRSTRGLRESRKRAQGPMAAQL